METNELTQSPAVSLGARLRAVRNLACLSQEAVGVALGMTAKAGHVYVSKLERGKVPKVSFWTVVRYVQACKVQVGKFMLELAQSGAFGEAESRISSTDSTDYADRGRIETERRAKARARHEQSAARAAEDADIIVRLWREVLPAIQPLLPRDPTIFLSHYLEGVRAFYRAWKQATRGTLNRDPTLDVQMAFDRVEQAGLEARLIPAAVRKMREIVFERLMAMTPRGGSL